MARRSRGYQDFNQTMALTEGVIVILLVLALIAAFVVVTLVVFVVLAFVRYHKQKLLWIALGVCVALCTIGVLLTRLYSIGAFLLLLPVGIAVLVIACLVVWLKSSDTLMRENVSLVDAVLHSNWFSLEDRPIENEHEKLAA